LQNTSASNDSCKITVTKNGPYLVSGNIPLFSATIECNSESIPTKWVFGEPLKTPANYALCRCGQSKNKPFCDGSHLEAHFDGTEVSDNEPFEKMSQKFEGPSLVLKDAEILCASARFCHRGGDIWAQIYKCNNPIIRENVARNAFDCPSGRLVVTDIETKMTLEPKLAKSIGFIEDPGIGVDGPLWIRGGVPVYSEDGKLYERRNRITLCRCGKSTNKPFCDSSHYPEEEREVKS
jgi:CDGSH-type Zn-finger protein